MEVGLLWLGSILTILIRWTVSLYPYSGMGKKPMFGDYEAQRHWMEITYHLPVNEWYNQTEKNDLQYWGLDYPPLTAYHSYICGLVANAINPKWVALTTSRGFESYHHKLFMRYSVILVDLLIYYTAIVYYFYKLNCKEKTKACGAVIALLYPGLILIDHGHFQYNCVSLGLMIWAVNFLQSGKDMLGAVAFTLALNYKQMELYHAFPVFFYLLGTSFQHKSIFSGLLKVFLLGVVVASVFITCWLPFLSEFDLGNASQVLHRIFPVDRGLYEDKVANFWCSLSILIKFKQQFTAQTMAIISGVTTLALLIPSNYKLLTNPNMEQFKYALINSSIIFYLFSFQVHEKSILLAAIPVTLILHSQPLPSLWFLIISVLSMFPLLLKDKLLIPYVATSTIYLIITYRSFLRNDYKKLIIEGGYLFRAAFFGSILASAVLSSALVFLSPPKYYPDLFSLAITIFSCGHFLLFLVYYHYLQFKHANQPISTHKKRN